MIKKIKLAFLSISSVFAFTLPALVAVPAYAFTQDDINKAACAGTEGQVAGTGGTCNEDRSDFNDAATLIINIISMIIGFVAVIMIIFGGFRYITSGGDSTKVGNAKNTILYGLIGLVIVALAQVIVQFVLHQTDTVIK